MTSVPGIQVSRTRAVRDFEINVKARELVEVKSKPLFLPGSQNLVLLYYRRKIARAGTKSGMNVSGMKDIRDHIRVVDAHK